jgi:hypothetical protein
MSRISIIVKVVGGRGIPKYVFAPAQPIIIFQGQVASIQALMLKISVHRLNILTGASVLMEVNQEVFRKKILTVVLVDRQKRYKDIA